MSAAVNDHAAWSELAAGWVLDALDPADERTFRAHLHTCARCQQEVAAHLSTASHLVASLSESTLATPEMPLLLRKEAGLLPGPRASARRARTGVMRSRWISAVAASIVALVIGGGIGLSLGNRGSDSSPQKSANAALIQALDKGERTTLSSVNGTAEATAVVYAGKGYIVADGLPGLSEKGQHYVAWIAGTSGEMRAVATFQGGPSAVYIALGQTSGTVHTFAVSREKLGTTPSAPGALVLASA